MPADSQGPKRRSWCVPGWRARKGVPGGRASLLRPLQGPEAKNAKARGGSARVSALTKQRTAWNF